MPGKALYLGLRRSCIKPWRIKLFVQPEGQVFYSTVETKMLIAEINVRIISLYNYSLKETFCIYICNTGIAKAFVEGGRVKLKV